MSGKFDELSEADIAKIGRIVEALDRSGFDYLSLDLGGFKLTVGTGNVALDEAADAPAVSASAAPAPATPPVSAPAPEAGESAAHAPAAPTPAAPAEEGLVDVTATTMGHFYSRPEPTAEPFVTLGATVEADSTIGLIEVMKLFNGISAGVAGTVAEICVEDAQLVEYGQVLMRVRPAE